MTSFSQVQRTRDYPGGDAPFNPAQMLGPQPVAHDSLDAMRMSWRSTPEATYPDGYLGTIHTRREDRLLDSLKTRATNRPYTRGVHKGERIERRDYFWPPEFNLWSGLEREAQGMRFSPPGAEEFLPNERYRTDHRVGPRGAPNGGGPVPGFPNNPDRTSMLRTQAPPWGVRGNPGMATPYPGR